MIGRRVHSHAEIFDDPGGAYMSVVSDGRPTWLVKTPNGHLGHLGRHEVVEHGDGTITVSPSILVSDHTGQLWHGYLERGVWREA